MTHKSIVDGVVRKGVWLRWVERRPGEASEVMERKSVWRDNCWAKQRKVEGEEEGERRHFNMMGTARQDKKSAGA